MLKRYYEFKDPDRSKVIFWDKLENEYTLVKKPPLLVPLYFKKQLSIPSVWSDFDNLELNKLRENKFPFMVWDIITKELS